MPICDLCGSDVSAESYCHIATMPNPLSKKEEWFLSANDSTGNKQNVSGAKPPYAQIIKRLSEALLSKQADIREISRSTDGPANFPGAFKTTSGKLFFCNECVAANENSIIKTGVAFVKGQAKKPRKGWWPF